MTCADQRCHTTNVGMHNSSLLCMCKTALCFACVQQLCVLHSDDLEDAGHLHQSLCTQMPNVVSLCRLPDHLNKQAVSINKTFSCACIPLKKYFICHCNQHGHTWLDTCHIKVHIRRLQAGTNYPSYRCKTSERADSGDMCLHQ